MRTPILTLALAGAALVVVPATAAAPAPTLQFKSFQLLKDLPFKDGTQAGVRWLGTASATTSNTRINVTINGVKQHGHDAYMQSSGGYGVPTLVAYLTGSELKRANLKVGSTYKTVIKICARTGSSCRTQTFSNKLTSG